MPLIGSDSILQKIKRLCDAKNVVDRHQDPPEASAQLGSRHNRMTRFYLSHEPSMRTLSTRKTVGVRASSFDRSDQVKILFNNMVQGYGTVHGRNKYALIHKLATAKPLPEKVVFI